MSSNAGVTCEGDDLCTPSRHVSSHPVSWLMLTFTSLDSPKSPIIWACLWESFCVRFIEVGRSTTNGKIHPNIHWPGVLDWRKRTDKQHSSSLPSDCRYNVTRCIISPDNMLSLAMMAITLNYESKQTFLSLRCVCVRYFATAMKKVTSSARLHGQFCKCIEAVGVAKWLLMDQSPTFNNYLIHRESKQLI